MNELRTHAGRDSGALHPTDPGTGLETVRDCPSQGDGGRVPRTVARPAIPSGRPDYAWANHIKGRCRIDDITGCWIWTGAKNNCGPVIYGPDYTKGRVDTQSGRRAMHHIMTGRPMKPGEKVWGTCGNPLCVRHSHSMAGTQAELGEWQREHGVYKGSTRRKAAAKMMGRARRALSDEQIQDVVASTETLEVLSARYGVSKSTASRYRNGCRGIAMGVFSGLMGAAS